MSEFAAFATKLPRIPSHKIRVHYRINPSRNIHSIQNEEGIKRLFGIESLHNRMLSYKRAMSKLNLLIIHRFDARFYWVLDAAQSGLIRRESRIPRGRPEVNKRHLEPRTSTLL